MSRIVMGWVLLRSILTKEQKILSPQRLRRELSRTFTEDTEETCIPPIIAFLCDLCVLGGKMLLTSICSPE